MNFSVGDIVRISSDIWTSILDAEIRHMPAGVAMPEGVRTMIGCVQITGEWEGAVTLYCPEVLARNIAGIMFGMSETEVADEEIQDTVGELTNMMAGGIKALLPSPSFISLPSVAEGIDYKLTIPGGKIAIQTSFMCEEEPLQVTVLERSQ